MKFNFSCPYRRRCTLFLPYNVSKSFNIKIVSIISNSFCLCVVKRGHSNKKCSVVSALSAQRHVSTWVSRKLWFFLWLFKGLSPTLTWKIQPMPLQLRILKVSFSLVLLISTWNFKNQIRMLHQLFSTKIIPGLDTIRIERVLISFCSAREIMENVWGTESVTALQ